VTRGWRRLHNEAPHNLYAPTHIIRVIKSRRMKWAEHVARMGEVRNACNILVGKTEGKRPLRRPRRKWENNIRMNLKEMRWKAVDFIHMVQYTNKCGRLL
jgi:hypothetical protein